MQPVFMHRPQGYPPRGRIWPTFDDTLGRTLNVSEEAQQNLAQKRQGRMEEHMGTLKHHGLMPPFDPTDEGTQTEGTEQFNVATQTTEHYDIGSEPPSPRDQGQGGIMQGTGSVIRRYAWPFTKEIGRAAGSAAVAGVKHGVPAAATIAGAAIRHGVPAAAWAVGGIASGLAGLASGSEGPLEIDEPDGVKAEPDDDVAISGIALNRNQDLDFWRSQSGNELKAQLYLRNPRDRGNWAFKSKDQLVGLVDGMIRQGTW